MRVGVVSGLQREAACLEHLRREQHDFGISAGVGPELAERAARDFVDAGVSALMSFGVAGGLSAAVPSGTVVLGTTVVDGGKNYLADEAWLLRLGLALKGQFTFVEGPVIGTDQIISTPAGKRELSDLTGALACDMESHAVARIAAFHGLPFSIVRAISDPYDRYVPDWVVRCLTPTGGVMLGSLLREAVPRPFSWGELVGLSRDAKKAFNSLRCVSLSLGPGLRF